MYRLSFLTKEHSNFNGDDGETNVSNRDTRSRTDVAIATFAIFAIVAHDAVHVSEGRWYDVFWVCNVAALLVGPAILWRSPAMAAASMTWLLPGTIVWLVDVVVAGSSIIPTSYAVHLGGTAASFYAVRISGYSHVGWIAALGVVAFCVTTSWAFLPEHANVNAAHSVPKGWSFMGEGCATFALAGTLLVLVLSGCGHLLSRWVARRPRCKVD